MALKDSGQRLEGDESKSEPDRTNDPHSVHPVIMIYQSNEMSLFPPVDQDTEESQTYFLDDESYATESLGTLFEHCRSVLADSINDTEELEIKIPELGLAITEVSFPEYNLRCGANFSVQSSIDSGTITLSQILDIFIQLSNHDGVEDPGPLYMELNTNYKFSPRLEYLMTAVVEGKGLSQLEFLNVPEDLNGEGEHDQEIQNVTEGEPQSINHATDTGFEHIFSTDDERQLKENLNSSEQAVEHIPREANIDPLDDVTSAPKAKTSPLPLETATAPESSTSSEKSGPEEQSGISLQSQQQAAADDDDIIDYSDEEFVPELSARSSTLQGDGSNEKIDGYPARRPGSSNHINHDITVADSTDIDQLEPQHPRSIQESDLDEEFEGTVDEGQDVFSQEGANAEEANDLDEIIDYEEEILGAEDATQNELHNADLKDHPAHIIAAYTTHTVASNSTKSFTDVNHEEHDPRDLTSDLGFDNDFSNIPENISTLEEDVISHNSPRVVGDVEIVLEKPSGIDHEVRGKSLPQEAQVHHGDLIDDLDEITYDEEDEIAYTNEDEIAYDDNDEITIPDQVELAPKPAPSPPSLKRLRDHQDEENASQGISPGQ